jgi:hypothetical protein
MREYEVSIKGIVPLMHERFSGATSSKHKKKYDPKEECEKKLYRNKDGKIFQPAIHIEGALINAATNFQMKGRKSYKDFFKSSVIIMPQEIFFKIPEDPENYEIDERPVVIQRSRVLTWRPKWNDWEFDFSIKVLQDAMIDDSTVKEILEHAGAYVGIGSFRPKFGRFEVIKFQLKE